MTEYDLKAPPWWKLSEFDNFTRAFTATSAGTVRYFLKNHTAVPSRIRHASHGDLKSWIKQITDFGYFPEKKRSFMCTAIFCVILCTLCAKSSSEQDDFFNMRSYPKSTVAAKQSLTCLIILRPGTSSSLPDFGVFNLDLLPNNYRLISMC